MLDAAASVREALDAGKTGHGDAVISLPCGTVRTVRSFIGQKFPIKDAKEFLGNPAVLMDNPKPGAVYGWPVRNPRTNGLIRSGIYRTVAPSELKADCPYEVTTHAGVGINDKETGHIEWYGHILVEIHPAYCEETYKAEAMAGLQQLARRTEEFSTGVSSISPGARTSVAATPVKG